MSTAPLQPSKSDACSAEEHTRRAWVVRMRRAFSPPAMLQSDGSIDQNFFRPKQVVVVHDKRWGDTERDLLIRGIAEHGVGSWQKISESVLPGWDEQQLKLCTSRLLGTESLDRYTGWKGDAKAVESEHQRNQEEGQQATEPGQGVAQHTVGAQQGAAPQPSPQL